MNKKLYHLSEENLNNKIIYPRIPDNFMTKNNYEENKTKRISFSYRIEGALTGMSKNLIGKTLYVHQPYNYDDLNIKNISNKEVPDQSLTNEVWILNPIKLQMIFKIKVISSKNETYTYKYGENTAETYKWNYIILENED